MHKGKIHSRHSFKEYSDKCGAYISRYFGKKPSLMAILLSSGGSPQGIGTVSGHFFASTFHKDPISRTAAAGRARFGVRVSFLPVRL